MCAGPKYLFKNPKPPFRVYQAMQAVILHILTGSRPEIAKTYLKTLTFVKRHALSMELRERNFKFDFLSRFCTDFVLLWYKAGPYHGPSWCPRALKNIQPFLRKSTLCVCANPGISQVHAL